MWLTV